MKLAWLFYLIALFCAGFISGWLLKEMKADEKISEVVDDYELQLIHKQNIIDAFFAVIKQKDLLDTAGEEYLKRIYISSEKV